MHVWFGSGSCGFMHNQGTFNIKNSELVSTEKSMPKICRITLSPSRAPVPFPHSHPPSRITSSLSRTQAGALGHLFQPPS